MVVIIGLRKGIAEGNRFGRCSGPFTVMAKKRPVQNLWYWELQFRAVEEPLV